MKKEDFLKIIAETGYNVGFGAKKNFATYDIVSKLPGLISFSSLAIGIFALFNEQLTTKFFSAVLIILGIVVLYINFYDHKKGDYDNNAKELTQLFNDLKKLYYEVISCENYDYEKFQYRLDEMEKKYYLISNSEQILFSDWYAHYKFFWQHQIDWIEKEKNFDLLRDKIPLSFSAFIILIVIILLVKYFF